MKRQRTKDELLIALKTYNAVKRDEELKMGLCGNAAYWRAGVLWSVVLWKIYNFSAREISEALEHVMQEVTELSEDRREEIREKLDKTNCEWILKNTVTLKNYKSNIDRVYNELEYYNTETSVNYSLLIAEYLMNEKGFRKKRLDRAFKNVFILDMEKTSTICDMQKDLFDHKGIWINLNDEDKVEFELKEPDMKVI